LSRSTVPRSLVNFLRLPNYTFVGFGIKDNVVNLEKKYGFGCRNAVELGPLAASVMKRPSLSYCGVDELLFKVNQLDFRKDRPLMNGFEWWDYGGHSKELAKLATINVYSYHMIGAKLLAQDGCK
ncbi:werner syndrome ATP-dependent helicase, partial [Trifolium pratense]